MKPDKTVIIKAVTRLVEELLELQEKPDPLVEPVHLGVYRLGTGKTGLERP
jgi:hypothetical protein